MKYKIKHEKTNLILMTSVLILCLVTCIIWFILSKYIYFFIYLIFTLVITYVYYFTFYYINNDNLLIKLGFIKIRIKYEKIKNVENLKNNIKLSFKNSSLNIYPNNKDLFYKNIMEVMKGS